MNPICVIDKIPLDNPSTNVFVCPICKREYIMDYEILAYDQEIGTAFDDEAATIELEGIAAMSNPIIMQPKDKQYQDSGDNDNDNTTSVIDKENPKTKSGIKIPKYLNGSNTTKVLEYKEE